MIQPLIYIYICMRCCIIASITAIDLFYHCYISLMISSMKTKEENLLQTQPNWGWSFFVFKETKLKLQIQVLSKGFQVTFSQSTV